MEKKKKILLYSIFIYIVSDDVSARRISANDDRSNTICQFRNGTETFQNSDSLIDSDIWYDSESNKTFIRGCQACFAYWREIDNEIVILGQGCWLDLEGCSSETKCIHTIYNEKEEKDNQDKFCCCNSNNCNEEISSRILQQPVALNPRVFSGGIVKNSSTIVLIGFFILSSLICVLVIGLALIFIKNDRGGLPEKHFGSPIKSNNISGHHVIEIESSKTKLMDEGDDNLSGLEINQDKILGSGKFGTGSVIYSGSFKGQPVAVKIFSNKDKFRTEKDIYQLLHHNKHNFCQYYGSQEIFNLLGLRYENVLVISLVQQGSLRNFLNNHTINWPQLTSLLCSLTDGLTHLHSDTDKPSICHRDLNSANILVTKDYTCKIADFGLSLPISGTKYYSSNTEEIESSTDSLLDIGGVSSYRYMAPERLEGVLNLRDAETSLKQTDVYSLGLIFWEISRRCRDLYQGSQVPEFELAFQKELHHVLTSEEEEASLEQMRVLVARNKARPLFPQVWKDSNPAIQQLKETIEDSWDHDGEARLTTFCVMERISELSVLWNRYKNKKDLPKNNDSSFSSSFSLAVASNNSTTIVRNHVTKVFRTNDFSSAYSSSNNCSGLSSDSNTDNTTVMNKEVNVNSNQQALQKIQPHQGRNPCLERNVNDVISASEIHPLIEKSDKDKSMHPGRPSTAVISNDASNDNLYHRGTGYFSNHLISPALPIPYLQNDLSSHSGETPTSSSSTFLELAKENNTPPPAITSIKNMWLPKKISKNKKQQQNVVILDNNVIASEVIKSNLELQKQRQKNH